MRASHYLLLCFKHLISILCYWSLLNIPPYSGLTVLPGPSTSSTGHWGAVLGPGKVVCAESAHGGASCKRENWEDHKRGASESCCQPWLTGTLDDKWFYIALISILIQYNINKTLTRQVVLLVVSTRDLDANRNSPEEGTNMQHEIYHKIGFTF